MKRREREAELLGMAAGKLERVLGRRGIVWKRSWGAGSRKAAVGEFLGLEYAREDEEAERRERRGRKRLREAMGEAELREEIRELLWDLYEEGQKPVGGKVGLVDRALGGVLLGGDQEVKKRLRRALRLRGWVGGLSGGIDVKKVGKGGREVVVRVGAKEYMGKARPGVEVGMKKAWLEIQGLRDGSGKTGKEG